MTLGDGLLVLAVSLLLLLNKALDVLAIDKS